MQRWQASGRPTKLPAVLDRTAEAVSAVASFALVAILVVVPFTVSAAVDPSERPPAARTDAARPAPERMAQAEPAPSPPARVPEPGEPQGILSRIQEWLARSNRDYQGVVIKQLSLPPGGGDDAIARKLEETKAEEARQAEAARQAQEAQKAAAAKKLEDERKRAAEAAAAKKAEDARKSAEAAKPAPPPTPKPEDVDRIAEELRKTEARQQEEARRREEERQAAAARAAEDERQRREAAAAEEQRRAAEAEQSRNRTRKIVLTSEPIDRPDSVLAYRQTEGRDDAYEPEPRIRRTSLRGSVKGWRAAKGCRAAGRVRRPPSRYTVRRGDSLWRISRKHYRAGRHYARIWRANRRLIRDPDLIYPCQRFYVPRRRY